jgi:hypothetical protein
MSWSTSAHSAEKQVVKDAVNAETYCPDSVKQAVANLVDACPDGKQIYLSTSGHHNDGEIANVTINISVS